MNRPACMPPVLLCACLAAGLLFDPMGFLRMALVCSVIHEAGHVLVYFLCARRLPRLRPGLGGVSLEEGGMLTAGQDMAVLCAGPAANFLFSSALYVCALRQARYGFYFLAAVSLCTGLYNLLPLGVLDGTRILQNLLNPAQLVCLAQAQRGLLVLLFFAGIGIALCAPLPPAARVAALLAPGYLLLQNFFC